MKQCNMHNPLVNSMVLIAVLSLFIGLMLSTGGFFSGIWAFIVLVLQTIHWSIALTIGILFCLAFLIGIFLLATAYHDKDSAIRISKGLKTKLLGWVNQARGICPCIRKKKVSAELAKDSISSEFSELVDDVHEEVVEAIESSGTDIAAVRKEFDKKIESLNRQLQVVQESTVSPEYVKAVASEMVESTGVEIIAVKEAVTTTDAGVKELHTRLNDIAGQVEAVKPENIIGDIPARLEKLEKQEMPAPVDLNPVQNQITALQNEVAALKEALAEARSSAVEKIKTDEAAAPSVSAQNQKKGTGQEDEHRLLSYYDNQADKQKLLDLVNQTLKKDMTYAQVMNFLIEGMDEESGKVISEHPSLAKDYIRHCRRNA